MNAVLTGLVPSGVVVIVHGPLRVARDAVARAGALCARDGRIVVVAGTRPGVEVVRRLAGGPHTVVDGHGPEAIAAAIRSMDARRVLVLHDDVEIDAENVGKMLTAAMIRDGVVVPASARPRQKGSGSKASLACALGSTDRLGSLAEQLGFTPGLTLDADDIVPAGDVTHRHAGSCAHQLAGPDADDGRPLLVAAMIVRDESLLLGDCLASLAGVVDRIEIADTGSTDDTVAIAEAAGAVVERIGWRDDFAWARNQVLERCRDAHLVLMIDADERLVCEDPRQLRQFLNTHRGTHAGYGLRIDNRAGDAITHSHRANRLVAPEVVQFEGAVHEQAARRDGRALTPLDIDLCHLDHVGYAAARVAERDKTNRNLAIALSAWQADPTIEHAVRYYRELAGHVDHPERTLAELDRVLPDLSVVADPSMRASLYGLRGRAHLLAGDAVGALVAGREATELCPADAVAGAVLAESLVRLGRHREALDSWRSLAERPSPRPVTDDVVAAQTRAETLVGAAAAAGELAVALELIPATSPQADPWPLVLAAFAGDDLVVAATSAGAHDDARFIAAMLLQELDDETVTAMRAAFARSGGALDAADEVAIELAADHSWELARNRFVATGTLATALRYARVVSGSAVLAHLDDDASALRPESGADDALVARAIAAALEVAALAHRDAERSDAALADAVDAVALWPGVLRAAALAADAASAADMVDVSLELIDAARRAVADDQAHITPVEATARHELADAAVRALLAKGDIAAAAGEALDVIEDEGRLGCWEDLLAAARGDDQMLTLVIGLALLSDGSDFIAAVTHTERAARTAELCLVYLASGGTCPDAVITGLLAAAIAGRGDLAVLVADHGALVDGETAGQLAAKLREKGADDAARRLEREAGLVEAAAVSSDTSSVPDGSVTFGDGLAGGFRIGS
ncbi:MAG: glycosyltransferase [Acidimicrobiales bacterium]